MVDHIYKYPRLYLNASFLDGSEIALTPEHAHYLKTVLRKNKGDMVRVFNGHDGEWVGEIGSLAKKNGSLVLTKQIKVQPEPQPRVHMFFAPIKKQRMDMLIEKAVELGVDALHPVITNRTENRKLKEERVRAQIIEASEQSERLDIPVLHDPVSLSDALLKSGDWGVPFYACIERDLDTKPISSLNFEYGAAFLIGPEGGFDDSEIQMLSECSNVERVGLGDRLLRCETAAIVCLSYARIR